MSAVADGRDPDRFTEVGHALARERFSESQIVLPGGAMCEAKCAGSIGVLTRGAPGRLTSRWARAASGSIPGFVGWPLHPRAMSNASTATKVLDGFVAARTATASGGTLLCCREVVASFRTYVETLGAAPVDDLTAYRLTHDAGREPTEHELAAVLSVIEHVTGFFESQTSKGLNLADAADVVRGLAGWLVQRRLIDEDVAEHLGRYTHLYDGDQRTGT